MTSSLRATLATCVAVLGYSVSAQVASADAAPAPTTGGAVTQGSQTTAAAAGAAPSSPPTAAPAAARTTVALLRVRGLDVDPSAVSTVDAALQSAAISRGLTALPAAATILPSLGILYPRAPADVWYVTRAVGARYGVYATVRAEGGQYVVHVTVADEGGAGPFLHEERADAEGLHAATARALWVALDRAGLPAPSAATTPEAARPAAAPTETEPTFSLLRLAVGTRAAFGLTDPWFYNHLGGAAIDRRFSPVLSIGLGASYANLKGPDGRAHNVLFEARFDYRARIYEDTLAIPLRVGVGYLPRNGPTLQLSSGLAIQVSERVDLVLDLLAPMLWVSEDLAVTSLNAGLELGVDFQ